MEAEAKVEVAVGSDTKHERKVRGHLRPIYKPLGFAFTVPAGTTGGQFDIPGSPQRGRSWNILKVTLGTVNSVTGLPDLHTPGSGTTFQATTPGGGVTGPGAGQILVSIPNLPGGDYTVQWTVGLGGTTGAPETNNFGLLSGGTLVDTSNNRTSTGSEYPQTPVTISVPPNGTVAIEAIGAGTATAVYDANLTLTATSGAIVDVYAGTMADGNTPPTADCGIISGGSGNVPSINTFPRLVEWCASGERIVCVVYGANPGQVIWAAARVAEYETEDIEAVRVPDE